jgi:hypothetical protein
MVAASAECFAMKKLDDAIEDSEEAVWMRGEGMSVGYGKG